MCFECQVDGSRMTGMMVVMLERKEGIGRREAEEREGDVTIYDCTNSAVAV